MIAIHYRAATDLDLRALAEGRGSLARNVATASLPVAGFVFGIVYLIWRSFVIASVAAASLFVASLLSNVSFFRAVRRRRLLKSNGAAVEVFEVSAERVLDLEPVGDNGPAYCFFGSDRQALLLVGQWLLRYASFPARAFRVYRWADTKRCIRIEVTGSKIDAEHSVVRLRPGYRFRELEVIEATPDTLQDDLDRTLSP